MTPFIKPAPLSKEGMELCFHPWDLLSSTEHFILDSYCLPHKPYFLVHLGTNLNFALAPLFNLQAGRLQMVETGLVTAAKQQKIMHHSSILHRNNLSHLLPDKTRPHLPKDPTNLRFKRVLEVLSNPCQQVNLFSLGRT